MNPLNLHLVLKGEFYNAIKNGKKTVEYRDNTLYWRKRTIYKWSSNGGNTVTFHRGYTKETMTFQIRCIVISEQIEIYLGDARRQKNSLLPELFPNAL